MRGEVAELEQAFANLQAQSEQQQQDSLRSEGEVADGEEEGEEVGEVAPLPERRPSAIQKQRTKPNIDMKSSLVEKAGG